MTNDEWMQFLEKEFAANFIPMEPTVGIACGIRFDFCRGFRLQIPKALSPRRFRLTLVDLDHNLKVFDDILEAGDYYVSKRRYVIRYGFQLSDADSGEKIFQHEYNPAGMPVVIDIPVTTLGDSIAWFSCCEAFQKKHHCKLHVCLADYVVPLFEKQYPEIRFIPRTAKCGLFPYAAYTIGIFHDDGEYTAAPVDYRQCALHHYAARLLGIDPAECDAPPRIFFDREHRTIAEPYVAIATQASGMCKTWVNPTGWTEVVKFLRKSGFRVIDIDRAEVQGNGIHWNHIPRDAEDFTGDKPLTQRAELIANAEFFIGLGSGLSWLAWCCRKPVVLISGFSLPEAEFYTPYRIINFNVCHGCYSDTRYQFDHREYDWCPKHRNTPRHYECTRCIGAEEVIRRIRTIPEFQKHQKKEKKK